MRSPRPQQPPNQHPPNPLIVSGVVEFLHGLGFGTKYDSRFTADDIDGAALILLTDGDLAALGLTLGHRRVLLNAVRSNDPPPPQATTPPLSDPRPIWCFKQCPPSAMWGTVWEASLPSEFAWTLNSPNSVTCSPPLSHPICDNIKKLFKQGGLSGKTNEAYTIVKIELVKNDILRDQLNLTCQMAQRRRTQSEHFNTRLDQQQLATLDVLRASFLPPLAQLSRVSALLAWHGCDHATASKISSLGFANLAKVDAGYFGSGIYLTVEAEYAAMYSVGVNETVEEGPDGHTVVLALVAVGQAYPVTRTRDYQAGKEMSRFYGRGFEPGFDTHFAPVSAKKEYQAAPSLDDVTACEVVASSYQAVLPVAIVHFRQVRV
eukprot:TRINITY_DN517_c0_g1_i3.p1 TRINITY_DN517_c0_g1~~TRINITY_DN517_c0_g1_i3.p1  ORF type:complete len:376 (+),score=88.15 TRINITY_DN517_c0_g1_i3:1014-2141(+)